MNSETGKDTRSTVWVLVADSAQARLFSANLRNGSLTEEEQLENPEARMHEGDFATAARGHLVGGKRGSQMGGHSAADDHSAKKQSSDEFARKVGESLHRARLDGAVARLYLIAEPRFLGELREHLDEPTRRLVVSEIGRSLVGLTPARIREHLPAVL